MRSEAQPKADVTAPAAVAHRLTTVREPVVAVAPAAAPTVNRDTPPALTAAPPEPPDTGAIRPTLPRFEQLLAGGIISVQPLHLDIHVYAGEPSKRFVFINMNKYREGEHLTEGPVVEEITNDGVILKSPGQPVHAGKELIGVRV